jgi:hypothetical protein
MTKRTKIIITISSALLLLVVGVLLFFYFYLNAFAPPQVTITKDHISANIGFVNGVTIEKILVDSIGVKGYPIKYTTIYTTSCNIKNPINKPQNPLNKIEFNKPGKYSWDEDTVKVRYIHNDLSREPLDSISNLWWLNKFGNNPVCPIKFEKEQWYFIIISDPRVTGIFFYMDKSGKEYEYLLQSGVSPI